MQIVGEQIRLARLRRNLSIAQVAERATCSPLTVSRIEKGVPTVAIGIYLKVLYALQLDDDILLLAKEDAMGKALQDVINQYGKQIFSIKAIYHGLATLGILLIAYVLIFHNENRVVTTFTSITIIASLYYFMPHRTNRFILWLDKNSFGIYLFHSPLMYIIMNKFSIIAPPAILVPMNLIFGIGGSLIITYFLRAIKCSFVIGEKNDR